MKSQVIDCHGPRGASFGLRGPTGFRVEFFVREQVSHPETYFSTNADIPGHQ